MKIIPLTRGKFAMVDDEDFGELSKYKWCAKPDYYTFYAIRTIHKKRSSTTMYMPRQILGITDKRVKVDHKDGNGLNNQRSNLRVATNSQNGINSRLRKDNKVGCKGVWKHSGGKYQSAIRVDRKLIHLGTHETVDSAAQAYKEARIKYFGKEFAYAA